ncbi:MAG: radical SAM protein [Candidatus Geothermincolia bacterium]
MKYEEPLFRPPCEAGSLIFQVTIGCPHNECAFCGMYKWKKFRVRDLEEIKAEAREARPLYPHVPSIFLADGNTVAMNSTKLAELISYLRSLFPETERVSSYGGARFLAGKPPAALRRLADAGLDIIYMGLESGDDRVLERMRKGVNAVQCVEAGVKVREAGIQLSTYILLGLGGKDGWETHARETARVLNLMRPHFIRPRTLALLPGIALHEDAQAGLFAEANGETVMRELRLLLDGLEVESVFLSDHISNYVPVYGELLRDKEKMLASIDQALADPASRLGPRHLTHL